MGVLMSLHAWDEQYQLYISDSKAPRPPAHFTTMFHMQQTDKIPPLSCNHQAISNAPYMQLGDTADKCIKSVSTLILSAPMSPIGGRNPTSTTAKCYCIDAHQ